MSASASANRTRSWASGCVLTAACLIAPWPAGALAAMEREWTGTPDLTRRVRTSDGELVVLDGASADPRVRRDVSAILERTGGDD